MIPLPNTELVLPKGTKLYARGTSAMTLTIEAVWTGSRLNGATVRTEKGTLMNGDGNWPQFYVLPTEDHPWRVLDQNAQHALWEATVDGVYYQCVAPIGLDAGRLYPVMLPDWRAELGAVGWRYRVSDQIAWSESSNYVPRTPRSTGDAVPVAASPPEPTPDPPKPKWPIRSDRVAVLRAEMSMTSAERLKR